MSRGQTVAQLAVLAGRRLQERHRPGIMAVAVEAGEDQAVPPDGGLWHRFAGDDRLVPPKVPAVPGDGAGHAGGRAIAGADGVVQVMGLAPADPGARADRPLLRRFNGDGHGVDLPMAKVVRGDVLPLVRAQAPLALMVSAVLEIQHVIAPAVRVGHAVAHEHIPLRLPALRALEGPQDRRRLRGGDPAGHSGDGDVALPPRALQSVPPAGPLLVHKSSVHPQLQALRQYDDGKGVALPRRAPQTQGPVAEIVVNGELDRAVLITAVGDAGAARIKAEYRLAPRYHGAEPQTRLICIHFKRSPCIAPRCEEQMHRQEPQYSHVYHRESLSGRTPLCTASYSY